MKSINPLLNEVINTEQELDHIVQFVKTTWSFPVCLSDSDIFELIKKPFDAGIKIGSTLYPSNQIIKTISDLLIKPHLEFLNIKHEHLIKYDGFQHTLKNLIVGSYSIQMERERCFNPSEEYLNQTKIARKFLNNKLLTPKGFGINKNKSYSQIKKDYDGSSSLDYWDKNENGLSEFDNRKALFKGHCFTRVRSPKFIDAISIHNVLYSHVEQGQTPLSVLISEIVRCASEIAEYNNTIEPLKLLSLIEIPKTFQYDIFQHPQNKYLDACFRVADKQFTPLTSELEITLNNQKLEYDALNSEDKRLFDEAKKTKNHELISGLAKNMIL